MDADSPYVVRLLSAREPHRFLEATVGDAVHLPALAPLKVGYDSECAIRHERGESFDEDAPPQRRSQTMSLRLDDCGDVIAAPAPGSVVHFTDARGRESYARRPMVVAGRGALTGMPFGPATGLRMQIEHVGARPVAARVARVRGLIVDDPPAATLFIRRAVRDGRLVNAVVAVGAQEVAEARVLVIVRGGLGSPRKIVTSEVAAEALLLTVEDDASVGADELFDAMEAAGEHPDRDVVLYVVECLARQAVATRAFGLDNPRVRLRDGMPLLSPWAHTAPDPLPGHIVAGLLRRLSRFRVVDISEKDANGLSARAVADRIRALRIDDDDETRARLRSLVGAWFPSRARAHADFLEQASCIETATVATWQVPEEGENDDE